MYHAACDAHSCAARTITVAAASSTGASGSKTGCRNWSGRITLENMDARNWLYLTQNFESPFVHLVGAAQNIRRSCEAMGKCLAHGVSQCEPLVFQRLDNLSFSANLEGLIVSSRAATPGFCRFTENSRPTHF